MKSALGRLSMVLRRGQEKPAHITQLGGCGPTCTYSADCAVVNLSVSNTLGRKPLSTWLAEHPRWKVLMDSGDRELVLPRARTSVAIVRANRECKAAGRSRCPGKDPGWSERQSCRQAATWYGEAVRTMAAAGP